MLLSSSFFFFFNLDYGGDNCFSSSIWAPSRSRLITLSLTFISYQLGDFFRESDFLYVKKYFSPLEKPFILIFLLIIFNLISLGWSPLTSDERT